MRSGSHITVIIPALNEEGSIGHVLDTIPEWVDRVIVADNGSHDGTREVSEEHGAEVVREPRRGYGSACLKGIASIDNTDVVVFLDADFSDYPDQMDRLVDPILANEADVVIGSRVRGEHSPGALTPQARFGNQLACYLMRIFWGVRYTDLGPFRAVRYSTLLALRMRDPNYGWTVEMQIRAALLGVPYREVPVDYRKRIGRSKVSGTVRGVMGAGTKILSTIFLSALRHYCSRASARPVRERLVVFTRYPEPGATKTRLVPALGREGAADLQRRMTERALSTARRVGTMSLEVRYTGATAEAMKEWLGTAPSYAEQGDGDLGDRMARAFTEAFATGYERVVIIGIDSPELSPGLLRAALDGLRKNAVVLGPATDGGYYLIGVRRGESERVIPSVFEGIEWGTEGVLNQTQVALDTAGVRAHFLAPLDDVDRPEDLGAWNRAQGDLDTGASRPAISVIIPTLNEASTIGSSLSRLAGASGVETIVVDGGSDDGTTDCAREHGAVVILGPPGRAAQMNFGSAKAVGDILLFLHADTHLPESFEKQVLALMEKPGTAAGAFRFSTGSQALSMRLIEWCANVRSRLLSMPYGDQGFFINKDLFREVGGFPEIAIMEDFALVRKVAWLGRVRLAPVAAVTSPRRWQRMGKWRVTLYNQAVVIAYHLGVPPDRLAQFYNRLRGL